MKTQNLKLKIQNKCHIIFAFCILLFALSIGPAYAETRAQAEGEEYLTKGEAIMLMSTTDFMKKRIGELLSWTIGYDISKVTRVRLIPSINYIKAVPKKSPPDGRTIVEILASVDDPGGLGNIAGVRADLSTLGRLSNTMLVDNGLFGDEKADDGIYTLQTTVSPRIDLGPKEVSVAVANKKGWLALAKTSLDVKRNPAIIEVKLMPPRAKADGRSSVILTVKIDNPGRIEDIEKVTADLRAFGYSQLALMRNDGQGGDTVAKDNIFTVQFVVPKDLKDGDYSITVGANNLAGGYGSADVVLKVYK